MQGKPAVVIGKPPSERRSKKVAGMRRGKKRPRKQTRAPSTAVPTTSRSNDVDVTTVPSLPQEVKAPHAPSGKLPQRHFEKETKQFHKPSPYKTGKQNRSDRRSGQRNTSF